MKWISATATHSGHVRQVNEDAVYTDTELGIWAVADGMGGHYGGKMASQMLVSALGDIKPQMSLQAYVREISRCVEKINRKLCFEVTMRLDSDTIGTTAVIAVLHETECACLWAGDSRMYVHRNGDLYQITKDHSLVQELLDDGSITVEEARNHPQSHVITRAVGVQHPLYLDVVFFKVESGDQLLLCSDGFYNQVPHETIAETLNSQENLKVTASPNDINGHAMRNSMNAERLLQKALAHEARDNVSINLIRVLF